MDRGYKNLHHICHDRAVDHSYKKAVIISQQFYLLLLYFWFLKTIFHDPTLKHFFQKVPTESRVWWYVCSVSPKRNIMPFWCNLLICTSFFSSWMRSSFLIVQRRMPYSLDVSFGKCKCTLCTLTSVSTEYSGCCGVYHWQSLDK